MAEITLRPATPDDAHALAQIQTQAWQAAFCTILPPDVLAQATHLPQTEAMYQSILEQNPPHIWLQLVDGTPQGLYAWGANRDGLGTETAELICIHSLPQFWGRGLGSHMMRHLLCQVQDAGYTRLVLWVFQANSRARAFYQRHGFVQTAQEKETFGAKELMYTIDV